MSFEGIEEKNHDPELARLGSLLEVAKADAKAHTKKVEGLNEQIKQRMGKKGIGLYNVRGIRLQLDESVTVKVKITRPTEETD